MPQALLLLPLAIALAAAGPRLGSRAKALCAWLGWVVAGGLLLGLPNIPPHSALDHRMLLTPLLLVPMLAPKRWATAALGLCGAASFAWELQSLWGRSALWESLGIGTLACLALLGSKALSERPHRSWLIPLLGLGVGIVLAVNCSIRLGIEALVLGGVALCLRGHPSLNCGALLGLAGVIAAACAYAEAMPFLPLIGTSVLAAGVLRARSLPAQLIGVSLPLLIAMVPGVIELMRSPL